MKIIASSRLFILSVLLFFLFAVLEGRLFDLQVLRHDELEKKAEEYQSTTRVRQSWRGSIVDCNGMSFALTVPVENVYANLQVWSNHVDLLAPIAAPLLGMDKTDLARRVRQGLAQHHNGSPGVLLLKRGVAPADWALMEHALTNSVFGKHSGHLSTRERTELSEFRNGTLYAVDDQNRFYPQGDILAQVLGFVGTGGNGHYLQGMWGLEARLDSVLAGSNGVCVSSQDAAGHELPSYRKMDIPARDGGRVVLTVDLNLQRIVEAALARVMAQYHPINASCVIIRPATGEILAMASAPTFSPQHPDGSTPSLRGPWADHVISDQREVGSVFKVITLAAALEQGAVTLDTPVYCEEGCWYYHRLPLHDDKERFGWLTVREALAKSSNIGFAKIGLAVGANQLAGFIQRFGFDQRTGLPLPYEKTGYVCPVTKWTPTSITRIAIGQEIGVTQLQVAMAYAAIANQGRLMRPMLVREIDHADGKVWGRYAPKSAGQVVRPDTARQVIEAMRGVVEHGTGTAAALVDYTVAGKTGTAEMANSKHYLAGCYYSSFVGMVPAGKPELVIAVAVDQPKGADYGGLVAAPVFHEIAAQAVVLYNIPPDKGGDSRPPFIVATPIYPRR